jgi:hypothetical protein
MLVDMNLSSVGWSSPLAIYCSSPHKVVGADVKDLLLRPSS